MFFMTAVFAPLFGAMVAGLFGRWIGDRPAQAVSIICMLLAAACGPIAWVQLEWGGAPSGALTLGPWIYAGTFQVDWALRYDALSATMVAMVSFVSMLIHVYSIGYMAEDKFRRYRFFAYLSLFTFSMLMLVTANNLLQLFFGWEGVGVCSYLLIGYWYDRPAACAAAIKAMIVNRIGDLAFALGIALMFLTFGSIQLDAVFQALPQHQNEIYTLFGIRVYELIALLLFIGAMGKSSQIILHVWLPDAMEGPTPVSALIHAATMVTAGVFLMARMGPLLNDAPDTLAFIEVIGATTAMFAATIGITQFDIKRIIAYSTVSELGFMMIGIGVGAYQTAIFLLICHAFFKALLFLCAGAVITQQHEEQDIRKMGGLWRKMPITYVTFWIAALSLGGMWPFAGFQAHDAVTRVAYAAGTSSGFYGYIAGVVATYLTCVYIFRELYLVFHGTPRMTAEKFAHSHEAPSVMTGPLAVLAVGATVAGFLLAPSFVGAGWQAYWGDTIQIAAWNHAFAGMEDVPALAAWLPLIATVVGLATVYVCYVVAPLTPAWLATTFRPIYLFFLNKWYFDELYDFLFVRPAFRIAHLLWQTGDATLIDGVPNGLAELAVDGAKGAVRIQTGSIAVYAFTMLIGLVVLVGVFLIWR
jgi:NADH-quinone oxidoreductase subunit L